MKRTTYTLVFIFLCISNIFSQDTETVLSAPDSWKSEIIPFPLGFAREIDFKGFEDLRFAPNWSDSSHNNFWTYCFVWYIDKGPIMTEDKLDEVFCQYYDGLMGGGSKDIDKTICLFIKTKEGFNGKMRVYDRFFTKNYITLNIKVNESYCMKTGKQIIRCEISPKPFNRNLWKQFEEVKLRVKCD